MSDGKQDTPRPKKKFLYLDKFTDHLTGDQEWKKNTTKAFQALKSKVDTLLWVTLIGACLAMAALLISVMH